MLGAEPQSSERTVEALNAHPLSPGFVGISQRSGCVLSVWVFTLSICKNTQGWQDSQSVPRLRFFLEVTATLTSKQLDPFLLVCFCYFSCFVSLNGTASSISSFVPGFEKNTTNANLVPLSWVAVVVHSCGCSASTALMVQSFPAEAHLHDFLWASLDNSVETIPACDTVCLWHLSRVC